MTITIPDGSLELDESGEFVEMRTGACKIVRTSPNCIKVFTTAGTSLKVECDFGSALKIEASTAQVEDNP